MASASNARHVERREPSVVGRVHVGPKTDEQCHFLMLTFETGRVEQASRRIDGRRLAGEEGHITRLRGNPNLVVRVGKWRA